MADKRLAQGMFADMDIQYGYVFDMYKDWLSVTEINMMAVAEIVYTTNTSPGQDLTEVWTVDYDDTLVELYAFGDVSAPGFSIGHVVFGTYKGYPVILEQNASPILIIMNKEDLEILDGDTK